MIVKPEVALRELMLLALCSHKKRFNEPPRMFCIGTRIEYLLLNHAMSHIEVEIPENRQKYEYKWQGVPVMVRMQFEYPYYIDKNGIAEPL